MLPIFFIPNVDTLNYPHPLINPNSERLYSKINTTTSFKNTHNANDVQTTYPILIQDRRKEQRLTRIPKDRCQ